MTISRRGFMAGAAGAALSGSLMGALDLEAQAAQGAQERRPIPADRFDPWIEVYPEALTHNVEVLSRLAGGRPITAVIKNNGYGLGVTTVARLLEPNPQITGFAVVKTEAALALRAAGIQKPILLMALFGDEDGAELVSQGIQLALSTPDSPDRAMRAAATARRGVEAHVYVDTGMSRMGVPYHQAVPFLNAVAGSDITIRGTFTGLTEEEDFDGEQARRLRDFAANAPAGEGGMGPLHAASSHGVFNRPETHLDMVRPGISLFGAYSSDATRESGIAELQPAVSLKARVVRVEQLRVGDSVSYGRNFVAEHPTWVATIPVGHTDGYPRTAVNGAHVLINGELYPPVGAISASHTIVNLGPDPGVRIGDVATLLGPGDWAVHPNGLAEATNTSVYDRLMHLNPGLPKIVV